MANSSAAPGRVILLTGTPSSGKTTIARSLWEELEPPHWYRSLDDLREGYQSRRWRSGEVSWDLMVRGFIVAVAGMARAGHNVITEAIILPNTEARYVDALLDLTVFLVGVRCPLRIAQERERSRSRLLGPVQLDVPDFELVHAGRTYDVEFDTSVVSVAEAVSRVRARLDDATPPTAFAELWEAYRRRATADGGARTSMVTK